MRAVALGEITPQEAALLARVAAVMVQAQRLKLRIEQQKAKTRAVVTDPPEEASRSASEGSDARVEEREESSRAAPVRPVSRLYSRSHPAGRVYCPCIFR
jgi:hypothetical protein